MVEKAKSTPQEWLAGNPETAARVDPTIATAIMTILQIVLLSGLHTRLGIETHTLFEISMALGMLATLGRRFQQSRFFVPPAASDAPPSEGGSENP